MLSLIKTPRIILLTSLVLALCGGCDRCPSSKNSGNPGNGKTSVLKPALNGEEKESVTRMCVELASSVEKYRWKIPLCTGIDWVFKRKSIEGRPLIYAS